MSEWMYSRYVSATDTSEPECYSTHIHVRMQKVLAYIHVYHFVRITSTEAIAYMYVMMLCRIPAGRPMEVWWLTPIKRSSRSLRLGWVG